jgi:hypothetical protein
VRFIGGDRDRGRKHGSVPVGCRCDPLARRGGQGQGGPGKRAKVGLNPCDREADFVEGRYGLVLFAGNGAFARGAQRGGHDRNFYTGDGST